jgi:hypothetical protein
MCAPGGTRHRAALCAKPVVPFPALHRSSQYLFRAFRCANPLTAHPFKIRKTIVSGAAHAQTAKAGAGKMQLDQYGGAWVKIP